MAKSSKKQIREDELKVLSILQQNARESADSIAEKCGFSRQKAWRIINRLEENKTIWGYGTIVDGEKIELKEYLILIKKTNEPVQDLADVIISRDIERKSEDLNINIESSHYLHGLYDWAIEFTAKDLKQAKRFTELLNATYRRYIQELMLIEKIFSVKKNGISNPDIKKLKEFV